MLSENDCSTDHPVIGPSGEKVDQKPKKGQLKRCCSNNHPGIGPPGNCSGSIKSLAKKNSKNFILKQNRKALKIHFKATFHTSGDALVMF